MKSGAKQKIHQKRRRQRGQALIELALIFPVVAALIFGFYHLVAGYLIYPEQVDQAATVAVDAAAGQQRLDQACAAGIFYATTRLSAASIQKGAVVKIEAYQPQATTPSTAYVRGGRIVVTLTAKIPFFGTTRVYSTSASEEIQPGRARYPVRQPGSSCLVTL